jgi:hypothetical protein
MNVPTTTNTIDKEQISMEHSLVEPSSPYTKFSMVVDVEALVFSSDAEPVLEQVGFCVVNDRGNIVTSGRFFIYQPFTITQLAERSCLPVEEVERSVYFYQKITRDSYLHFNTNGGYADEIVVKEFIAAIADRLNAATYAKNTKLEERVFGNLLHLLDLEWYGCPKYPFKVHDPQKECIFFAQFIPSLRNNAANAGQQQFSPPFQQQQMQPQQQYQSWGNRCGQLLKDAYTTFINTSPMVFQHQQSFPFQSAQTIVPQSSQPSLPVSSPQSPEPVGMCMMLNTSSSNASYTPSTQVQTTLSIQETQEDAKRTYAQVLLGVRTPTPSSTDDTSSTCSSRSSSPCYDATVASFVPDRFLDANAVTLGSRPHPVFYKGKTTKPPLPQQRYVQKTFSSSKKSADVVNNEQMKPQPHEQKQHHAPQSQTIPPYMQRPNTFVPTIHGAAAVVSYATTVSSSLHASPTTTAGPSFVKKPQQQIPSTAVLAETTFSRQTQKQDPSKQQRKGEKNGAIPQDCTDAPPTAWKGGTSKF